MYQSTFAPQRREGLKINNMQVKVKVFEREREGVCGVEGRRCRYTLNVDLFILGI